VTFAEWDACVSVGECPKVIDSGFGRGAKPVINVTWDEAHQYLKWLSLITGRTYRLPTEAEWEYASRGGQRTAYPWGDHFKSGKANCHGCNSRWDDSETSPVGWFEPNAFGLYDMSGNVWQWVEDCYHDMYEEAPFDGSAWTTKDCEDRVNRGGGSRDEPGSLRAARRDFDTHDAHSYDVGFRVVRVLSR
jgi:formylglycine-generating enzyme required for sulfatase activity